MSISCWPDEMQELLLKSCLYPDEDACHYWNLWLRKLRYPVNYKNDAETLRSVYDQLDLGSQRLLPFVYKKLSRSNPDDLILRSIKGYYRHTWYRNQILIEKLSGVVGLLAPLNIEVLCIKGLALSILYYKDMGMRPMSDIDMVVKPRDANLALKVLQNHGWYDIRTGKQVSHVDDLLIGTRDLVDGKLNALDFHWRLFKETYYDEADEILWNNKIPLQYNKLRIHTLNSTDHLLNILVHGMEGNLFPSIRWVSDALIILQNGNINWEHLIKLTADLKYTPFLKSGINYLYSNFNISVPDEVLKIIESLKPSSGENKYFLLKQKLHLAGTFKNIFFRHYQYRLYGKQKDLLLEIRIFIRHYKLNWGINKNSFLIPLIIIFQLFRLQKHPFYKMKVKR